MVRRWNHLKGDSVRGRRVLYVHLPVSPDANEGHQAVASKSKSKRKLQADAANGVVHHKVQPGETLSSIAKSHNVTVDDLKENNGNLANLRPGMVLVISNHQPIVTASAVRFIPISKSEVTVRPGFFASDEQNRKLELNFGVICIGQIGSHQFFVTCNAKNYCAIIAARSVWQQLCGLSNS